MFTVCWTQLDHTHGPNGQPQRYIFSLSACKAACVSNSSCVAIDYDHDNRLRQFCWLLTSTMTGPAQNVTHYRLTRSCNGTSPGEVESSTALGFLQDRPKIAPHKIHRNKSTCRDFCYRCKRRIVYFCKGLYTIDLLVNL